MLFGDVVGSTAMQEHLDPESARLVMARFYDVARAAVERHGGQIHRFVGDAVLAVFGTPVVSEDDAIRAVRCAVALQSDLEAINDELERTWDLQLRVRVGVNTGEIVVSDGELVGDALNTAARFEQAAAPGEVLVGESTWRLVRHDVQLEPVPPLDLKGKADPVRAWRVTSVQRPGDTASIRADSTLVGREGELARLRTALDDAIAARACRVVTVIGSPGIGKSRLASALGSAVAGEVTAVVGHCQSSGEGSTFLPFAEILREVARIGEADADDVIRAHVAAVIDDDPERDRIVDCAVAILGVGEPAAVEETFWALRRILEALARRRAMVIVLDDVHWAPPLFLDFVAHLVDWMRDAPVLLVVLARPELREVRPEITESGRDALDVIELAPLDDEQSRALVASLLGPADLPAALSARILETSEGNPLFLGELLRMLVDDGVLRRVEDAWELAGEAADVDVPPTVHALLAARVERLRSDERAVIERAAVIGKQFYRGAVAELVAPPVAAGIDLHLDALRGKEMVEPEGSYWIDEPIFRFHHVLIRDAAYRSLLKDARADLHERFADWLEAKAGVLVGEHEEVIAFHLEQAHEYRRQLSPRDERTRELGARAAARLHLAGRRALAREDLAAAINLVGRALEREPDEDGAILWDLGEALLSAGDTVAAVPLVERLRGDDGDPIRSARADVLAAQLANLTGAGNVAAAVDLAARAADMLATHGDRAGEAKAHHVRAQTLARLGQVGAVEAALDIALERARAAGDRRRVTAVLAGAPRAALWGPSAVVRASGRCVDVVRVLRMTPGNRHVEAVALRCQAVLEAMRGRAEAAREILAATRATLEELGLTLELHETALHAGIVELLAEDPAAAEVHARGARDGFVALGVQAGAAEAAALLARTLVEQGRHAEALAETRFAETHGGEDLRTTLGWCGARAEALAQAGDHEEARALAAHAIALSEPTDALAHKADAALSLARVVGAAGDRAAAREAAQTARGLYEAKGHLVGAQRAARFAAEGTSDATSPAATPGVTNGPSSLGDHASRRVHEALQNHFNARRLEDAFDLGASDIHVADHRGMSWEEVRDREGWIAIFTTALALVPDLQFVIDEVFACDDRVIAMREVWKGRALEGGGPVEYALGSVAVVEGGRIVHRDLYEPDDLPTIMARYEELRTRS